MRKGFHINIILLMLIFQGNVQSQSDICQASTLQNYTCLYEHEFNSLVYLLHWRFDDANDQINIRIEAATGGWLGFAFAATEGAMSPADFVIGYIDGEDIVLNAYYSEIKSISTSDINDSITLSNISGQTIDGTTSIEFTRSINEGNINISKDTPIPINIAYRSDISLGFHDEFAYTLITLNAQPESDGGSAPSPEIGIQDTEPEPSSEESIVPQSEIPLETPEVSVESSCIPSDFEDFDCSLSLSSEMIMHWIILDDTIVRIAVVGNTLGWVSVAFAQTAGEMVPAVAIIGWFSDGADVKLYDVRGKSTDAIVPIEDISLRDFSASEADGQTTIIFELDVSELSEYDLSIDFNDAINMNWAIGSVDGIQFHDDFGSETVDFLTGSSSEIEPPGLTHFRSHGALMLTSWIGLIPLGVIFARYKYIFNGISESLWFQLHRSTQAIALILMIVGYALALGDDRADSDILNSPGKIHRILGYTVLPLAVLQVLVAMIRPHKESSIRIFFNYFHWYVGRGSVILAIVTVFYGIDRFEERFQKDGDPWRNSVIALICIYGGISIIAEIISIFTKQNNTTSKDTPKIST